MLDEPRRGKRRRINDKKIAKQKRIIKNTLFPGYTDSKTLEQPHRLVKQHAMDCGRPRCGVCGNPRRINKELSLQEKKFLEKVKTYDN